MDLLPVPPARQTTRRRTTNVNSTHRRPKPGSLRQLKPEEYAKAVLGYSRLPTGAGQNHVALGAFLAELGSIHFSAQTFREDFVTVYPLGDVEDVITPSPGVSPLQETVPSNQSEDHDSSDHKHHKTIESISFQDPGEFYHREYSTPGSCIIFLRGYMTSPWINAIGARHMIDPEFFCRHLDFRPGGHNTNNFSIPPLPSTSWHLIELPIITIGAKTTPSGTLGLGGIEQMRRIGAEALETHHHQISKLSSSGMAVGDSMVRQFYIFDETHYAIEQRISICMQTPPSGNSFSLIVWLDSGADFAVQPNCPWAAQPPESRLLPVIRHQHMAALKCHLFAPPSAEDQKSTEYQPQSAALLPKDYGRSLHSRIMASDAFYSLHEVFSFAASSQIGFLNLIDSKLDVYTSLPPDRSLQSLSNLRYTSEVLSRHIQKTQRILESIKNAKDPKDSKWPKSNAASKDRKARRAAQGLEQDYIHLLDRATALHSRTDKAISILMSSMAIQESQKALSQAERVGKLTLLATIFVPLSFTTSFFGMNVAELGNNQLGIRWWIVMSVIITVLAAVYLFADVATPLKKARGVFERQWLQIKGYI